MNEHACYIPTVAQLERIRTMRQAVETAFTELVEARAELATIEQEIREGGLKAVYTL